MGQVEGRAVGWVECVRDGLCLEVPPAAQLKDGREGSVQRWSGRGQGVLFTWRDYSLGRAPGAPCTCAGCAMQGRAPRFRFLLVTSGVFFPGGKRVWVWDGEAM